MSRTDELDACIKAIWQWAEIVRQVADTKRCIFVCDKASLETVARRLEAIKRSLRGELLKEGRTKPGPKPNPSSVTGLIRALMSDGAIRTPVQVYEAIKPGRPQVLLLTVQQTLVHLTKKGQLERPTYGKYRIAPLNEENER